jgi:hypothetical protein
MKATLTFARSTHDNDEGYTKSLEQQHAWKHRFLYYTEYYGYCMPVCTCAIECITVMDTLQGDAGE